MATVLAVGSAIVCLYSVRQADPDLWGYLTYGRLFVQSRALTSHDPFAYTSTAARWTTFEYGAQLLLWYAYDVAGPFGLIALKCLVGGVALGGLWVAVRTTTRETFVWAPVFLLSTSAICRFFLFRPQLFTFAFFSIFVAVLFAFLLRRRNAPLWMLPIVMVVWANVHGGFVAGLGAVALAILLRASENLTGAGWRPGDLLAGTQRLWATLAACTAATFLNPLGPRLWGYVLSELSHSTNRHYIVEWAPASLHRDAWSAIMLTLIAITLAVVGWAAHSRPADQSGPRPVFWVASCVPLIAMSYVSIRHVPLAAIWTAPVIAWLASHLPDAAAQPVAFRRVWFLLRGVAVVPVALILAIVCAEPWPEIHVDGATLGKTHPCGAVEFLRTSRASGNLYNPLPWGAYITWKLYPSIHVAMDGRNVSLFPDRMVLENLRFYADAAGDVDLDAPLRYATDFLIVPTDAPVMARLLSDSRWRRVYTDSDAMVFERADVAATRSLQPALGAGPSIARNDACPAFMN
jgi:hypothetical protein